ncbi:MAG: hypothetical protein LUQ30_01640 [Methanothrix sp.]|nr:hypothetical protein [Methanothrix sp.]
MTMKEKEIKRAVKEGYARIAKQATSYYSSQEGSGYFDNLQEICRRIGYSEEEISAAPPESNLGLGCGNPVGTRPGPMPGKADMRISTSGRATWRTCLLQTALWT